MATTEAQKRASAKYHKEHLRVINLRINRRTEADILEKLEAVESMQGYIKALIREDIRRGNQPTKGPFQR